MVEISGFEKVKFKEKVDVEVMKPILNAIEEDYKMVGFGGLGLYQITDDIDIETV